MHHTYISPFIHTVGYPAKSHMGMARAARWRAPRPVIPRPLRLRVIGILLFCWATYQQHLFSIYRSALSAKYAPTEFGLLGGESTYRPHKEAANLQAGLLAKRAEWKELGAGFEGTTYVFNDTVIKTFTPGRSPFRNCAFRNTAIRWPTEIPMSLLLCGIDAGGNIASLASRNTTPVRCPPVKAAFYTSASPEAVPQWHLATPFARQGTLRTLSQNLYAQTLDFRTLDRQYRETFHSLLGSLHTLHAAGFCHDDIKPDNILIWEDSTWVVGDLGNVRQFGHAYHESRIWLENGQMPDCRANDAVRALKSYIRFLRAASIDAEMLDEELFLGKEPLSELFLGVLADARTISVEELRRRSSVQYTAPPAEAGAMEGEMHPSAPFSVFSTLSLRRQRLARRVEDALDLSNSEMHARRTAMTWIFGIDQAVCGGA
ncbi:hypothetical protein PMIN04_006198 [Paraphaeosphaeria minitans]